MRAATKKKVADLLGAAATTIEQYGRPRMRPGKPRPEATGPTGKPVKWNAPVVAKLSLLGALKADARELGYSRTIIRHAAEAILDVDSDDWHGGHWTAIVSLDESVYDTREIVRRTRRAQHALESELVTA